MLTFDKKRFAAKILEVVDQNGGRPLALVTKTGIPYQTIQAWYSGKRIPRIDKLFQFAAGAGVDVAELIGLKDSINPFISRIEKALNQSADPHEWNRTLCLGNDEVQPRHQKCRHDGPKALIVNGIGDMRVESLADGDI